MSATSAREVGRDVPRRYPAALRGTPEREIPSAAPRASRSYARLAVVAVLTAVGTASPALAGTVPPPGPLPQSPSDSAVVPVPAAPAPAPAPAPGDAVVPVPAPGNAAAPADAVAVAPATPAPVAKQASLPLRKGVRGPLVKDMQRELRRRGQRIAVDGAYGTGTVRAVANMQRRFHMAPNGRANARFLRRLGLQSLSTAGTTTAPAVDTAVLPSWVRMEAWPAPGDVTSPFGMRWGRMHEGIDIANRTSPPVTAALPGRVTFAGWESGYGNLVVLNHGNGLETAYGHLASITVKRGDVAATGQQLGVMGSTGRSTGIHLHFEVRVNGAPFNPLAALPARTP